MYPWSAILSDRRADGGGRRAVPPQHEPLVRRSGSTGGSLMIRYYTHVPTQPAGKRVCATYGSTRSTVAQ